jgi:hypothetical protein
MSNKVNVERSNEKSDQELVTLLIEDFDKGFNKLVEVSHIFLQALRAINVYRLSRRSRPFSSAIVTAAVRSSTPSLLNQTIWY